MRRRSLGLRLLGAQVLVVLTGALTTTGVATIVGPPLFREHLHRAGVPANSMEEVHAEEAYGYATVISIVVAVAVSAAVALAVTIYVSRRLQRSVTDVASAAEAVASGRYDTRVAAPHLGDDFDALARAFNQMAVRLQTVDETRQRLFRDLAHEIRTPVSVLEAYIEALEDGVRSLTPATAAMLRDQTRRLVRFSEDVAALAKAEESSFSLAWAALDVGVVVRTCVAAVRERFAAKEVRLTYSQSGEVPAFWGDEQRLAQVVHNLLENALLHTPPGGLVEVACASSDGALTLTVTDNGDGIDAAQLPRIFERLYRADSARNRSHGGAGLGLAIARALVEAHGGTIDVSSDGLGTGAAFCVTLPRTANGSHVASRGAAVRGAGPEALSRKQ